MREVERNERSRKRRAARVAGAGEKGRRRIRLCADLLVKVAGERECHYKKCSDNQSPEREGG
jgi:hypothetical protein